MNMETNGFVAWTAKNLQTRKDAGKNFVDCPREDGTIDKYWIEAVTAMLQSDYPEKGIVIERLRLDGTTNVYQYRMGHYKVEGHQWGQSALMIPLNDWMALEAKARVDGTIL
jgi:hypothetical protein